MEYPKSTYSELEDGAVLQVAQRCAFWTLPYLMPASSADGKVDTKRRNVRRDFQSFGALLVNNLAAKLAKLLFPSLPFFHVTPTQKLLDSEAETGKTEDQVKSAMISLANSAMKRLHVKAGYKALTMVCRHLIVTGSCLLHRDHTGLMRVYGVHNFVVQRDHDGQVVQGILRKSTQLMALPPDVQAQVKASQVAAERRSSVTLYTWIKRTYRDNDPAKPGYTVEHWVENIHVETEGWYPVDQCPYIFPYWNLVEGESYGRSHVEDYAGDFNALSSLSIAEYKYLIEALRVLYLVGPGAGTTAELVAKKPSGSFVAAQPENFAVFELERAQKLQLVEAKLMGIIERLRSAFMWVGNTRDAERVTAYELQQQASEIENTLGGVYSSLSSVLQEPLAYLLMNEVSKAAGNGFRANQLTLNIVTGIPALGMATEVQNLSMATQVIAGIAPVLQLDDRKDPHKVYDMVYRGYGVDTTQLDLTPEQQRKLQEASQAQQQAQQQLIQAQGLADQAGAIQDVIGG